MSHRLSPKDTVSITQYSRCQSCEVCHALWMVEGEQVGSRGQDGTLPDKPVTPFNTSAAPVIRLCVNFSLSWHRQQSLTPYLISISHTHTLKPAELKGWPVLTPFCDSPVCTILPRLWSIDPSCHPDQHPWPPSAAGDPWQGWRFKWFSSTSRHPVFPVSWLLMTTLEKGKMEILQTICPLDLQSRIWVHVSKGSNDNASTI